MDFLSPLLLFVLLGVVLFSAFFRKEEGNLKNERDALFRENTEMKIKMDHFLVEKSQISEKIRILEKEKNEFSERERIFSAENISLKNDAQNFREKISDLEKNLTKYESEKSSREKEFLEKIEKLEHAREKFHAEQERIQREDENEQKRILADRDRIWAEHENAVISQLKIICQKPEIDFRFFDNNHLPEHFYGHFKPDFLVDFLGTFLSFDAKVSRSENLESYLKNQFKLTAEKLKKFGEGISKNVFFVVPYESISSLKKRSEMVEGYSFFVISPEAIEPILTAYKMVSKLQNAEKLIASDSEKVVEVLANFEHFIKNQNATNILFAQKAFETLQKKEVLSSKFLQEFSLSLKNLKPLKLKESDLKKLSENLPDQQMLVQGLTTPEVKISEEEILNAKNLFSPHS